MQYDEEKATVIDRRARRKGEKKKASLVQERRHSRSAENLEIRGASCSKWARVEFAVLEFLLRLRDLTLLVIGLGPARGGVRVQFAHLVVVFLEVDGALVVRRDVASPSLLSAVAPSHPSRVLVRLVPHRVPPLVPVAAVLVALHQGRLDLVAPGVRSPVFALLQPVLQLAGAVLKSEIDLATHPFSISGGRVCVEEVGRFQFG
ncbi:hypothetical protein CIB48_g2236 [Xylaria polymorpha]|nr:hypothetical protein CIB48_g2236 [Xylaria polymorpha]